MKMSARLNVFGCVGTSGVAERFEVESQLLHTLSGLLIMLGVFWTGNQGNWLSLWDLHQNAEGTFWLSLFDAAAPLYVCNILLSLPSSRGRGKG